MKKITSLLLLLGAMVLTSFGASAQTAINVNELTETRALTTGSYVISGDNSSTPSTLTSVFTVAGTETVTITLDNVTFKTSNTASTPFLTCSGGSSVSIILKGANIFDCEALTASGTNAISLNGAGTFNLSQDANGGSFTMKLAAGAANATFVVLGYIPSAGGVLNITGGTYHSENTGTLAYSAARILQTTGSGSGTINISGGTFEVVNSNATPPANTSALIFANGGTSSAGVTINISGGTFTAIGGKIITTVANKLNPVIISGGSFTNNGGNSFFTPGNGSTAIIKAPSNQSLNITYGDNTTTLAAGATDATPITDYKTSLVITGGPTTGIDDSNDRSVYKLNDMVHGLNQGDRITVFSLSGTILMKTVATQEYLKIPAGLNIIKVTTNEGVIVLK